MSKKLYVGNLPFSVDNNKLKDMFSAFGEVTEAQVIVNKFNGRSKGFGFVTLGDEAADKAKAEMNNKEVEGRKIFVNEATPFDPNKPRERRGGFGGNGGGYGGGRRGGFGGGRGRGGYGERRGGFNRRNEDSGSDKEGNEGDAQFGSGE